ncbi:hypothetical protein Tco_1007424 [Tanacetum coccineum]
MNLRLWFDVVAAIDDQLRVVGAVDDQFRIRCCLSLMLCFEKDCGNKRSKKCWKGETKSVGKGKQKVSEGEAALGKKKRAVEKEKGIMVEDDVYFNKKKLVLPRPTGIVIREGGYVNVGSRSNSILNVGERAAGVDNVGGKRDVKTRFVVLDLRAREDLGQQPLALTNIDQQNC